MRIPRSSAAAAAAPKQAALDALSTLSGKVWRCVCLPESELCSASLSLSHSFPPPVCRGPFGWPSLGACSVSLMGDPLPWGIPAMFFIYFALVVFFVLRMQPVGGFADS